MGFTGVKTDALFPHMCWPDAGMVGGRRGAGGCDEFGAPEPLRRLNLSAPKRCGKKRHGIGMKRSLLMACFSVASAFGGLGRALRKPSSALLSTTTPMERYGELKRVLREVARLQEIEGILSYDEQVFLSEGSMASRAAQKETLAGVIHEKRTGAEMRAAVDGVRGADFDDARIAANVRDAIESYDKEARKSRDLAEREARLESECFVRLGVP